jgi:DNA (cytosine-5)-methyltransferase 1
MIGPRELVIDSYCGGGGASLGIEMALGRSPDIAINHDAEAVALHAANHAGSKHYAEDVWKVDPVTACNGAPVALMWLSPDCRHFSKAKGGKPVVKKIRGLAWFAVRWAKAVRPRVIVLENVEEFQGWGPVLANGTPCPERKGQTFRAFVRRLRRLGYLVEWRELRACDYGAPTIRKRLFLIARCDGEAIRWPAPTHGKGRALPWRTAAECIDWAIPCPSIFERKKPLAENTLRRIGRGIRRFVFECPKPFIVPAYYNNRPTSLDEPLQTITTQDNKFNLVTPVLVGAGGPSYSGKPVPVDRPLGAMTAENHRAIVAPLLVPTTHEGDSRAHSVEDPMRTITGAHRGEHALVAPTLIQTGYGERDGQAPRSLDLNQPLGTVVGGGVKHALVAAFLAKHYTDVVGATLFDPVPTVTSIDHNALVTSSLINMRGTSDRHLVGRSMEEPLATISGGGIHAAEVRAFLVAYYGTEQQTGSLFEPAPTIVSKDRFGLVTVEGVEYQLADIGMRMLAPRELYTAQGFPLSYRIDVEFRGKPLTKTAQVRMCGNSVAPPIAAAIVRTLFPMPAEAVA